MLYTNVTPKKYGKWYWNGYKWVWQNYASYNYRRKYYKY